MSAPTNINEALLALQADPPVITKNKNGHQSRYADLVQVNREVLSRLNALGVVWSCLPTLTDEGKFVLDYALVHVASGSKICGQWPLKLSENPQQMGSATTYGRRYALLAVTGIAAEDEDDDGQAASGRAVAQRRQQQARPTARRRATGAAPALPGEDDPAAKARRRMFALLRDADLDARDDALAYIGEALGKPVETTKDLTAGEVAVVVDRLTAYLEQSEPGGQDG